MGSPEKKVRPAGGRTPYDPGCRRPEPAERLVAESAGQVQRMLASVGAMPEEALRSDGMFGPRVDVPDDADDQTRLLGLLGRRA